MHVVFVRWPLCWVSVHSVHASARVVLAFQLHVWGGREGNRCQPFGVTSDEEDEETAIAPYVLTYAARVYHHSKIKTMTTTASHWRTYDTLTEVLLFMRSDGRWGLTHWDRDTLSCKVAKVPFTLPLLRSGQLTQQHSGFTVNSIRVCCNLYFDGCTFIQIFIYPSILCIMHSPWDMW